MRSSIEAERARLGMTKGAMSSALGVTLKTYGNYIRGGVIPSDILEKLADMTGCSIDYLLERAPRSDAGSAITWPTASPTSA